MIDYKSLMEKAEEEMLYQKPSTEGLVKRKPTTHQAPVIKSFTGRTPGMKYIGHDKESGHAILKDDAGNYVRVSYSGKSLIHANS
jgi:hypothetical protein